MFRIIRNMDIRSHYIHSGHHSNNLLVRSGHPSLHPHTHTLSTLGRVRADAITTEPHRQASRRVHSTDVRPFLGHTIMHSATGFVGTVSAQTHTHARDLASVMESNWVCVATGRHLTSLPPISRFCGTFWLHSCATKQHTHSTAASTQHSLVRPHMHTHTRTHTIASHICAHTLMRRFVQTRSNNIRSHWNALVTAPSVRLAWCILITLGVIYTVATSGTAPLSRGHFGFVVCGVCSTFGVIVLMQQQHTAATIPVGTINAQ